MVNTVGKGCSVADLAYFAGFLDADGAIMASIDKHKETKYRFRIRVVLQITQKDCSAISIFPKLIGVGRIQKNRTTYDWILADQRLVESLLKLVLPYLKVKRRQAIIALKIIKRLRLPQTKKRFISVAELADSLAKFNVRSKGRRLNTAQVVKEHLSRND